MTDETRIAYYASPIGTLEISYTDRAVRGIRLTEKSGVSVRSALSDEAFNQLSEYFDGIRTTFDFPIEIQGAPFFKRVLTELRKIPYGETVSYKTLAILSGSPNACRAVGNAVHRNPLFIVVPCHRVINSDGSIGGFAYGTDLKKFLLSHENVHI